MFYNLGASLKASSIYVEKLKRQSSKFSTVLCMILNAQHREALYLHMSNRIGLDSPDFHNLLCNEDHLSLQNGEIHSEQGRLISLILLVALEDCPTLNSTPQFTSYVNHYIREN